MSTAATMDNHHENLMENPGIQLGQLRQQKGYTVDYVASKLHLRIRIIELIEQGSFNLLPEPVFIKGYLRAYAKLLGASPEPFLALFNSQCVEEHKPERALWQSKRQTHKAEHFIRWFTLLFAVAVMIVIGLWWQNNRDPHSEYPVEKAQNLSLESEPVTSEIKLSDISEMQDLLTPKAQMSLLEQDSE